MEIIKTLLKKHNIADFAFISFQHLNTVKNPPRTPLAKNIKSVIPCIFPYYSKNITNGNISSYCSVPDYHIIVKMKLKSITDELSKIYPNEDFYSYVDISWIDEVDLAQKAGLGAKGKNFLFIHNKYGSFVFIGEIATSLELESVAVEKKECIGCNECIKKCPAKAISEKGIDENLCLSQLTQKKGELSDEEKALIKKGGLVWGCDVCQTVCPHNKNLPDCNNEFSKDIINYVDKETLPLIYKQRAFGFKGLKILLRNYDIIYND